MEWLKSGARKFKGGLPGVLAATGCTASLFKGVNNAIKVTERIAYGDCNNEYSFQTFAAAL